MRSSPQEREIAGLGVVGSTGPCFNSYRQEKRTMTIFEQVINSADVQMYMRPEVSVLSVLAIGFLIMIPYILLLPKMKFWPKDKENITIITLITTIFNTVALYAVISITTILLFINSFRIIEPLRAPVFEKSYSDTLISKVFVHNADKPAFLDKYRDDINAAINDKLNKYHVPECELDKPEKYQKSLLCGGYSLDRIPAVEKETNDTYMLTPKIDYDHSSYSVKITVREELGYVE